MTLALVGGAVAAVNPCGFAMLPAYLSLLVAQAPPGSVDAHGGMSGALLRAGRFAVGMTLGFVAVFGAFGAVVAPLALSVERYLPVLTIVLGLALTAAGLWLLSGRDLGVSALAGHGRGPSTRWSTQVGYGVTFALASLSCTVAPFLAVTSAALSRGDSWSLGAALLAYALGMGTVVLVLAVAAATASASVMSAARRLTPFVGRVSGVLLLIAGSYVAWYGWFEIRVLAGRGTDDPVVSAAIEVQETLTRAVAGLGAAALGVAGAVVLLVMAGAALRRRRQVTPL